MKQLLSEMRRRNIFRVAAAYLVVGWVLIQVTSLAIPALHLPGWTDTLVFFLILLGLPVALLLAWAFEMTPEGMQKTSQAEGEAGSRPLGSTDYVLIGLMVVVLGVVGYQMISSGPVEVEEIQTVETDPVQREAINATELTANEASTLATSPPALSVAVLPFIAMSSDEEDRYFADGLTEEILNYLTTVPELMVTSRTSAFQFRGDDLPPVPEIARQLGVAHIVEGSVRRSGDRVRVTAQIIRASDDSHLWSQTYDRTMDDIFAIQEDIAQNITTVLDIVLDADQLAQMSDFGVQNVEAYIAYQRGMDISLAAHSDDGDTLTDLVDAEPFFVEAIALAPNFSAAYMQQADYYAHQMMHFDQDQSESGISAHEAASDRYFDLLSSARATTNDPDHRAMIDVDWVYMRDSWTGAGAALDRAARTTGCPRSAWIAELSVLSGRAAELIPYAERMTRCDPLSSQNWRILGHLAYSAGQFDLAHEATSDGLRIDSRDFAMAFLSADSLFQAGRRDDLYTYMNYLQVDDFIRGLYGAQFAARDGNRDAAVEERLRMGPPEDDGFSDFELVLHAIFGERDAANAMAAQKDAEPGSHQQLIFIAARCRCGAPWDMEVTPNLARRLEEAEFPWPPPGTGDYPLKDW